MGNPLTYVITVDDNGDAKITVPGGAAQQQNANKLASLTEKLAKLLGRITERHKGKDIGQGLHVHQDGSIHQSH